MLARKRRKLDSAENDEAEDTTLLPGIAGEIDLEIGLRQRLVQTLQSRIAWARILQESLRGQKGALVASLGCNAQLTPAR